VQEFIKDLWRMMTFAARYGHSPPWDTRRWRVSELRMFNDALVELIEDEARAGRIPSATG
jgi:hypothetical protein